MRVIDIDIIPISRRMRRTRKRLRSRKGEGHRPLKGRFQIFSTILLVHLL